MKNKILFLNLILFSTCFIIFASCSAKPKNLSKKPDAFPDFESDLIVTNTEGSPEEPTDPQDATHDEDDAAVDNNIVETTEPQEETKKTETVRNKEDYNKEIKSETNDTIEIDSDLNEVAGAKAKNQDEKRSIIKKRIDASDDQVYTYALYDCTNAVDENIEIALIFEGTEIEDSAYNRDAFIGMARFAEENNKTFGYYRATSAGGKHFEGAIESAIANHAKIVITLGDPAKSIISKFQLSYPDVIFIMVDAEPIDANGNVVTANNTMSIIFNEEVSGFLAGYSMVAEGFRHFGFIGGIPYEAVKDYGYGFAQGINYASKRLNVKSNLKYTYVYTFEEADEIIDLSRNWYKNGCEVIFSCGGAICNSIIASANRYKWYVIGVDTDQSSDSSAFYTSAMKLVGKAIDDSLYLIYNDNFDLTNAKSLDFKNRYVDLEYDNSLFEIFKKPTLNALKEKLFNKEIEVKRSTPSINNLSDLQLDNVNLEIVDYDAFLRSLEE